MASSPPVGNEFLTKVASSTSQPHSTSHSQKTDSESPADSAPHASGSLLRLTVFSSVVLGAVALLPYAVLRTQFLALRRHVEQVNLSNEALQRDIQKLIEQSAVRRGEYRQLSTLIAEAKNTMEEVRRAGARREEEKRRSDDGLLHAVHDVKAVVERTETAAQERHQAGTEWRRDLLNRFRWPGRA